MWTLLSLILILLGIVAAEPLIRVKLPAASGALIQLARYRDALGFAGVVLAAFSLLRWLGLLHLMSVMMLPLLIALAAIVLTLALGFLYGVEFMRKNLGAGGAFLVRCEGWRARILPQERTLGVVAIVVGIVLLFCRLP